MADEKISLWVLIRDSLRDVGWSIISLLLYFIVNKIKLFLQKRKREGDKMEEKKALELKFEGEYLYLSVDPNKDGEKVIEIKISLKELPDEVISALKKD